MKRIMIYPVASADASGPIRVDADQVVFDEAPVEHWWLSTQVSEGKRVLIVNRNAVIALTVEDAADRARPAPDPAAAGRAGP